MAYIKLNDEHQSNADVSESVEKHILEFVDKLETAYGKNRWLAIARTDIEKGFMSLRRGITEHQKSLG